MYSGSLSMRVFSTRALFEKYGIYIFLVFLFAFSSLISPAFLKIQNLINIINPAAALGIVAIGQTFVILTGRGALDLSVASVMATVAVIVAMIYSRFRDQRQVQLLNRGIPEAVLSRAIAITFMVLGMLILACLVLLVSEHPGGVHAMGRMLFLEVVFEAFSAMGTVGLSMGLTPELSELGRIVIIILMYVGRVGPLTLALAVAGRRRLRVRLAEEDFWVG